MKLQSETNFSPQKFVEVFPEVKELIHQILFSLYRAKISTEASQTALENSGYAGKGNIRFVTSEQHFVWLKAKLFGDTIIMEKVLSVQDPAEVKKLGRKISPFDESTWNRHKYNAMFSAVLTKFQNSPRLKKLLIETKEKYIVEAAGYDFTYGIGLWEFSSEFIKGCKSKDGTFDVLPEDWNGENMLGIALMEVREILKGGPP